MQNSNATFLKDLAVLFLLCLAGYFQVALMQQSLKFDIIDQYFPWRRFAAECYHNGIIPFWNPYQHFGYAFAADPQSGAWYPLVWIAGLSGAYNVYANQLEFFMHVFIAGAGMYLLSGYLTGCRKTALATGAVYMLSGFFIGNAQHLTYLISGAWLPFVICYFLKMTHRFRWSDALAFSLAFYLMTSGGYPAFTIIACYVLVFLFLYRLTGIYRSRKKMLIKFTAIQLAAVLISGFLLAFVLVNLWQNINLMAKSSALPLKTALFNPFSPQSLISLFWPLVTTTDYAFFNTDMSMANLHFGLVMLTALMCSFTLRKNRREWLMLFAGIFFLLASFGEYTPVRKWLYDFVPLMNLFRFPSIFRLFALVCFLLSAALYLKKVFNDETTSGKFLRWVFWMMISVAASGLVFSWIKGGVIRWETWADSGFYAFIQQQGFYDAMQFQSLVLMATALLMAVMIYLKKKPAIILSAVLFLEMIFSAQINAPKTVYSEFRTTYIDETLSVLPAGFPVPENIAVKNYSDSTGFKTPFWRNLSLLRKQPGFDGYNSFRMLFYDSLADHHAVMNEVIKNPVAFFASTVSFYSGSIVSAEEIRQHQSCIYVHDSLKNKLPFFKADSMATIRFTKFNPAVIEVETESSVPGLLTLMQHFHPLRKVKVDEKPAEYFPSNYLMMTVPLPAGRHIVSFAIENHTGRIAFFISVTGLLAVLLCLGILKAKGL
jgi:hypothetical protein